MPSPFPGMDPYLETAALWPDVHHGLISELQAELNRCLRPKYHVRVEERVYISDENDPGRRVFNPDVRIRHTGRAEAADQTVHSSESTTAVVEPVVATTMIDDEIHEARLEVIDSASRIVVTVIEVLSLSNKVEGSRGQQSYRQKRKEVMQSPRHFVEIDLLRVGVPIWTRESLPKGDYFVHLSRHGERPKGLIWPILLPQRLPAVDIPVRPEDPDAKLDLQQMLDAVYDRAAYDLEIDYGAPTDPALPTEYESWVKDLFEKRER